MKRRQAILENARICGRLSGRDHDKFQAAGLEREESAAVGAACVRQCGANIECSLEREIDFEDRTWFVGRVVAARRRPGHSGAGALTCGRREYAVPGQVVAAR